MGPRFVVLKKGEHGAMFFSAEQTFVMPAYPTADVIDPTGAGDSFAGGFMGWLASQREVSPVALKSAMACGVVTASFTVEQFSLGRLAQISRQDLDQRLDQYRQMMAF
jgi:sugar/nucleoside kinase (ribokinase family)